jgi:hypothetical protein
VKRAGAAEIRRAWVYSMRFLAMLFTVSASLLIIHDILRYPLTSDLHAFLWGAERISAGLSPYDPIPGSNLKFVYGPWLGVILIPATWIPFPALAVIWHSVLAACAAISIWPIVRQRRLEASLAAVLLGTFLFHAVWAGHFEPILVALLVLGIPTRWGPIAIGVAASLKITPIVLCVVYAGRGEWRKMALSIAVAAILWAPALLFDLRNWGLPILQSHSLLGHAPIAFAVVAIGVLVAAWLLAPTRYGWLAAAALWLAVLPRAILYDFGGLAVGALREPGAAAQRRAGIEEQDQEVLRHEIRAHG